MKGKSTRFLLVLVALSLLAIPVLGACAPKAPPKEKVIKVGYLMDITGPISVALGKNTLAHWLAPYRYSNETAGLGDVKVEVQWEDYAFSVDRAVSAYKKMKDSGVVVVRPMTTLAAEAIQQLSTRDQIPLMGNSTTDKLADPAQWHYTHAASYTQMYTAILKWVKDNWKDTSRKPRVAQIAWDAPLGRGHIAPSEEYAKKIGVDIGPWEFIPQIPLDTTPNLLRIRDAKADFVVLQFGNPASADQVLRDAQKLGLKDKFVWIAGIQVIGSEGLSAMGSLSDGMLGIYDTEYPEDASGKFITGMLSRYVAVDPTLGRPYWGTNTSRMFIADTVALEAIKRSIAKVGYDKVDGAAVKAAMDTIKDFDPHGLKPKLTFGPQQRQGSGALRIVKVDFKALTARPAGDWIESPATYGPDGSVVLK